LFRGKRDRDAGSAKFVYQSDPAPARRTTGAPPLQIHVAHWQRDDRDARFGAQPDRLRRKFLGLLRERAAMAALDRPTKVAVQRRGCDGAQHARLRIAGFVDMQIERQVALLREGEKLVELILHIQGHRPVRVPETGGHHAQDASRIRYLISQCDPGLTHEMVERAERASLQSDAPGPRLAQGAEHTPADVRMRPIAVDMRAHRYGAVRISAGQSKGKPGLDIRFAPTLAVGRRSRSRGGVRPIPV
jgi:hypothetical protein